MKADFRIKARLENKNQKPIGKNTSHKNRSVVIVASALGILGLAAIVAMLILQNIEVQLIISVSN